MSTLLSRAAGTRILIDGAQVVFDCSVPPESGRPEDPDDLQFVDCTTGRALPFTLRAFHERYAAGRIVWPDTLAKPGDREFEADSPESAKRAVRRFWLTTFDSAPVAKSTTTLRAFIRDHADKQPHLDGWFPSPHTLRTWLRERGAPGDRRPRYMGDRHRKGARGSRMHPVARQVYDRVAAGFWLDRRMSHKDAYEMVAGELAEMNRQRSADGWEPVPVPSRTSIWRHLKRSINYETWRSRNGDRAAKTTFAAIRGSLKAERILDVAVVDHKLMDCFVVDEQGCYVVGRPWLTTIIDVASRMILGVHLGFDDPSVMTAMACLRMAVKPKLDVRARFGLGREWDAFGVPRTILADNAWEFVGSSFEDACSDAQISVEWAPVRTPEYKGICERFFRTLDDQLVHKLPGSIPFKPQLLQEAGIDPQYDAILTLDDLDAWLHRFIVEVYALQPHEGIGSAPQSVWDHRVVKDGIEFADNLPALERALAKQVPNRTLTRAGVEYLGLVYCSDAVTDLLNDLSGRQSGRSVRLGTAKVKIKYHQEDLSQIFVWNEVRADYVTLPCTDTQYSNRLSERLHNRIKKENRLSDRKFGERTDRLALKLAYLRKLESERDLSSIKDRRRAMRILHNAPAKVEATEASPASHRAIGGPSNRRGGDNPEKAPVRSRRPARKPAPRAMASPERPPTEDWKLDDPFAYADRAALLDAARRAAT
jgi:putative transposase